MESGDNVFKMMGPVLLRVEVEDAKQNVEKRLELIKGSMLVEGGRRERRNEGWCNGGNAVVYK